MRKRQKFVLTSMVLAAAVAGIQMASLEWRYALIAALAVTTWVMSSWSLKEGLSGIEWLTVPLLSVLFTAGVGFFYILLPVSIWARLLIIVLFGVGQYALLLTANIFSVAAIRTIALFRAATAVGFVMTILTGFLLYNTILSFRTGFWISAPLIALASFLLLLPALWSVELEPVMPTRVVSYSIWLSIMVALLSAVVSIWPVTLAVYSLFLATMLYVFLGITQHHFAGRLFVKTAWEYVTVGIVVLITMLATASI